MDETSVFDVNVKPVVDLNVRLHFEKSFIAKLNMKDKTEQREINVGDAPS